MIRKILLAGAAIVVGYVIGARAGFSAAVRDYMENDAEMLERFAIKSDRYNYPEDVTTTDIGDILDDTTQANGNHSRTYQ